MKSSFQSRCIILCSAMVVGLSVLSARLVQIQLVDRHRYAETARRSFQRREILPAVRAMIVDRREEPLAKSIPVSSIFIDKNHLTDPKIASYGIAYQEASSTPGWDKLDPATQHRRINSLRGEILNRDSAEAIVEKHLAYAVGILARPLGMRREELREKIENTKGTWFPVAKDLPEDIADNLRETVDKYWIQGFEFQNSIKRWYTASKLATHLTGFTAEKKTTNQDENAEAKIVGVFGVEASMEEFLAGRDGWREHCRDASGLVVPGKEASLMPPRAGLNVQLTIDMGLQAIAEEELDAGLLEYGSTHGAVVMMDPKTGEVLAMVSRPNFDLNTKEGLDKANANYALQSTYEPGSTIKIVATSGALNEGLVTPYTSVFCFNGYYHSGAVTVKDEHPAGTLTFEGVLQKSNNNGTCSLGRQLGARRFYEYLHNYGFGSKTGIQLSGESSGSARNTNNVVDFNNACFGYATSVTPLQLACAYSAIASDGNLRKPHIIKRLIANDGTVVENYPPEIVNRVLKPETARKMRTALEKVVLPGGTATLAAVPGFRVAGKTGTARKYNPAGGYYAGKHIVSFVGMMPADKPAFVCIVVVDDPHPKTNINIFGGTIAGPIFSQIASRAATYMNLQPTEPVKTPLASAAP